MLTLAGGFYLVIFGEKNDNNKRLITLTVITLNGFQYISIFQQVFEANIRLLGGLLSAHLLMEEKGGPFEEFVPDW